MEPLRKIADPAGLFGGDKGGAVQAPPPPAPPPPAPTTDDAARRKREQADAMARKRGRRASVLTGPEGVAATPVQTKTLIGS